MTRKRYKNQGRDKETKGEEKMQIHEQYVGTSVVLSNRKYSNFSGVIKKLKINS